MANPASLLNSKSVFDRFLFAPVGEDKRGTIVSVLTAFARLDFDPWQKAADFAQLPKDEARARLAAMLTTLPGMSPANSEPSTVADRLVGLLPGSGQAVDSGRSAAAPAATWFSALQPANTRSSHTVIIGIVLAVWLFAQFVMMQLTPQQPAGVDPASISATAAQVNTLPAGPDAQPGTGTAPVGKAVAGK